MGKTVAKFINDRREELEMSMEELGIKAGGISRSTIWKIENNQLNPTVAVMIELAKALECELSISANQKTILTLKK